MVFFLSFVLSVSEHANATTKNLISFCCLCGKNKLMQHHGITCGRGLSDAPCGQTMVPLCADGHALVP